MKVNSAWLWGLLLVAALLAACGGDNGESELMGVADGKLAPAGAVMKWEQEIREATTPAHVIRRYTWGQPPVDVRRFYAAELSKRGWAAAPGASADYAEWERDGMIISLVLEPPGGAGSEWSMALFAAE